MPQFDETISAYDEVTAAVCAAEWLDPRAIRAVYDRLPVERETVRTLPGLTTQQRAEVLAAIDRFEAAVRAKDCSS